MNRLQHEASPYLLQHAENPVDWYPWGEEAFRRAREEDKPVFLSIGYSTCHWCHVMAHESFEDEQVAAILNEFYVPVKVDREERPDIDAVYMEACQAMTGAGGWPLTLFLTPDKKPFYAATYLPKQAGSELFGLTELLYAFARVWQEDRAGLFDTAEKVRRLLAQRQDVGQEQAGPDRQMLRDAVGLFRAIYDERWGGFGPAPKFPMAHQILFLLRQSNMDGDAQAREMALHTLEQMARGGLYDQIGGGFARYSTDGRWLAPHFEKMLYDNALLIQSYALGYQMSESLALKTAAERTIDYVLSELRSGQGAFYCGQDADSEGEEGKFYVWTPGEILQVLGEEKEAEFCNTFGITQAGNFEGKNIPNLIENPNWEAAFNGWEREKHALYEYRKTRMELHRDEKVLTAWNSLMISGLALSAEILNRPDALDAAREAQTFIERNLTAEDGRLYLRWSGGQAAVDGQLADYACYACALMDLYGATFDAVYLCRAAEIVDLIESLFKDPEGGYFMTAHGSEELLVRPKESYDGAIPSGNSMAAQAFVRLAHLTGQERFRAAAEHQLRFLAAQADHYPPGYAAGLTAMQTEVYPSWELICVCSDETSLAQVRKFALELLGENGFILCKTKQQEKALEQAAPFTAEYPIPDTGAKYYLCRGGTCRAPVDSIDEVRAEVRRR